MTEMNMRVDEMEVNGVKIIVATRDGGNVTKLTVGGVQLLLDKQEVMDLCGIFESHWVINQS